MIDANEGTITLSKKNHSSWSIGREVSDPEHTVRGTATFVKNSDDRRHLQGHQSRRYHGGVAAVATIVLQAVYPVPIPVLLKAHIETFALVNASQSVVVNYCGLHFTTEQAPDNNLAQANAGI